MGVSVIDFVISGCIGFGYTFPKQVAGWVDAVPTQHLLRQCVGFLSGTVYVLRPERFNAVMCNLYCESARTSNVPVGVANSGQS